MLETRKQMPEVCLPPDALAKNDLAVQQTGELKQTVQAGKGRPDNEPLIYVSHWLTGGANHPGLIVETPGLANVAPRQSLIALFCRRLCQTPACFQTSSSSVLSTPDKPTTSVFLPAQEPELASATALGQVKLRLSPELFSTTGFKGEDVPFGFPYYALAWRGRFRDFR